MEDYEFTLEDREAKYQAINDQYDLETNGYISFSGGLDSMVNHVLCDFSIPNNKIPRVYFNTGIEYKAMLDFVKSLAAKDDRFIIINSRVNIKQMLNENGYPFKSKQHSHNWQVYNNNNNTELDKQIKYLKDNPDKQYDFDYIHNLPKGIKTTIKYIFGIREKTTDYKITETKINEFSRESYGKYITDVGTIEKATPIGVERERESSYLFLSRLSRLVTLSVYRRI